MLWGRLSRSSLLVHSREEHTAAQGNAWDSEAAHRGHSVGGRVQQKSWSPEREKGRRCMGAASGTLKDKLRDNAPLCLLMAPPHHSSRGSAPPGTNLHVLPLTSIDPVSREPRRETSGQEAGPSPWEPWPRSPALVRSRLGSWRAPLTPNQRCAGPAPRRQFTRPGPRAGQLNLRLLSRCAAAAALPGIARSLHCPSSCSTNQRFSASLTPCISSTLSIVTERHLHIV